MWSVGGTSEVRSAFGASGCGRWVELVGGVNRCGQWVHSVGVVWSMDVASGCGQWVWSVGVG